MKVAYHGEEAPKSLRTLVVIVVMSWALVAVGFIILSGVVG